MSFIAALLLVLRFRFCDVVGGSAAVVVGALTMGGLFAVVVAVGVAVVVVVVVAVVAIKSGRTGLD